LSSASKIQTNLEIKILFVASQNPSLATTVFMKMSDWVNKIALPLFFDPSKRKQLQGFSSTQMQELPNSCLTAERRARQVLATYLPSPTQTHLGLQRRQQKLIWQL